LNGFAKTAERAVLLVAHRLPTARCADRMAVLESCRVIEECISEELLARDGAYARFARSQGNAVPSGASNSH